MEKCLKVASEFVTKCTVDNRCNRNAVWARLRYKEGCYFSKDHVTGREHPTAWSAENDTEAGWRLNRHDYLNLHRFGGEVEEFSCDFHTNGVDSFWGDPMVRLLRPECTKTVEIPLVTYSGYTALGECCLFPDWDEGRSLDAALRFLRRRREYGMLAASIPVVADWGKTEGFPKFEFNSVRIGWTDGHSRCELVHPRIIWEDEFRWILGWNRLEPANKLRNYQGTAWIGRFL